MPRVSALKAWGCEEKTGEDVGREKASCVEDIAWPFREFVAAAGKKSDVNQPISAQERAGGEGKGDAGHLVKIDAENGLQARDTVMWAVTLLM